MERLEAAAEADRLGEGDIGLDLEVLGRDLPGGIPFGSKAVGLLGGEPSSLFLPPRRRRGQLAAGRGAVPSPTLPSRKSGDSRFPFGAVIDSERLGPAPLMRHVAQEPPRLAVIRLPLDDRTEALAGQPIARGLALGRALGQSEQIGGRARLDFLELGLPCAGGTRWSGSGGDHFRKGDEPRGAIRSDGRGSRSPTCWAASVSPCWSNRCARPFNSADLARHDRSPCGLELAAIRPVAGGGT